MLYIILYYNMFIVVRRIRVPRVVDACNKMLHKFVILCTLFFYFFLTNSAAIPLFVCFTTDCNFRRNIFVDTKYVVRKSYNRLLAKTIYIDTL